MGTGDYKCEKGFLLAVLVAGCLLKESKGHLLFLPFVPPLVSQKGRETHSPCQGPMLAEQLKLEFCLQGAPSKGQWQEKQAM